MSVLAPLFLLGGLAVALPVVFHLIRRTTRERTVFSSLMFLLPSPPRLTRRSRLEHLLLLALRCLVLCLLAIGFARPFLRRASPPPTASVVRRILLLVDASASMRREDLWADARKRVDAVVGRASPNDLVAVSLFDETVWPLVTFEEWAATPVGTRAALVTRKMAATSPGWSSTRMGLALIEAADGLGEKGAGPATGERELVLISDLQEGSHLDPLQGYEWPKGVKLAVESLKPRHAGNASLQWITESGAGDVDASPSVRLRVSNTPDARHEQFRVGWVEPGTGKLLASVQVYVPPGQLRIVSLPLAAARGSDRVALEGDDEPFDNTVFVVPPEPARLTVLYCGADAEQDPKQPLYFLERAFQTTAREAVKVLVRPLGVPIAESDFQAASLLIAAGALPDGVAGALRAHVTSGKTLLFALQNEGSAATLAKLLGIERAAVQEARPANYAMLAEIDFRHPLFSPFADPRFSDFTKIHFWKYRRVEAEQFPSTRVLARFDGGDPALFEAPIGAGHLLVLTSGWQPEDSQLALSTKFVPLLYSMLDYSGAAPPAQAQFHVGAPLPLPSHATDPVQVRLPDGSEVTVPAGETMFSHAFIPGVYGIGSQRFAVNLDAGESRTLPVAADELERMGAPLATSTATVAKEAARKTFLQNAELESRQKFWRWLLLLAGGVLLLESWLAGRTMRGQRVAAREPGLPGERAMVAD